MTGEGKYIYCIIGSDEARDFGPIGIGGRGDIVSTISYRDLSVVMSDSPVTKYVLSRENLMAHERVIEKVMENYTVLPVRFCTIAASAEEVRSLLRKRYTEFKHLLRDMDDKIELGLKAFWKKMDLIFGEITKENGGIRRLKEKMAARPSNQTYSDMISLGKIVKEALQEKKEAEAGKIMGIFKRTSVDFRINENHGDNMFLNAAFLVDRGREKEFDNLLDEIRENHNERIKLSYVGPVPPFNFVNIVVEWDNG